MSEIFTNKISSLNKVLRKEYQRLFGETVTPLKPQNDGSEYDSIGAWPEYILHTKSCKKSTHGCCVPCGYSNIPSVVSNSKAYRRSLLSQITWIFSNFEENIIAKQRLRVSGLTNRVVIAPTGSLFSAHEIPHDVLREMLDCMCSYRNGHNLQVIFETHVEDFLRAADSGLLDSLVPHFNNLQSVFIFGFESKNDYTRNVLYGKGLRIEDFERAINVSKGFGFPSGAFVFVGNIGMRQADMIHDASQTLKYLRGLDVIPVVMFANIKQFTIPHFLYMYGQYKIVEPLTMHSVICELMKVFGDEEKNLPWMIADPVGGPPDPEYHSFKDSVFTCSDCSRLILEGIREVRQTYDFSDYVSHTKRVEKCQRCIHCEPDDSNLLRKTMDFITNVKPDRYLEHEKRLRSSFGHNLIRVKAELLCLGIKSNPLVEAVAPHFNDKGYIHGTQISLENDVLVNVPTGELFVDHYSPFTIRLENNRMLLLKHDNPVSYCTTPSADSDDLRGYYRTTEASLLRPHSREVLFYTPVLSCAYANLGKKCLFCTFKNGIGEKASLVEILRKHPHLSEYPDLSLGAATPNLDDFGAESFIGIMEDLRRNGYRFNTSIEIVPPKERSEIGRLKAAGASSIIMNLELYDDEIRKRVCPGKSQVTIDEYRTAWIEAVRVFGEGNVSSVLIFGLEPEDNTIEAARAMVEIGVIPTIIPFKPYDDCSHELKQDYTFTDPERYFFVSKTVANMLIKKGLSPSMQRGCTRCGGCSLEKEFVASYDLLHQGTS
jgi:radical SAM enzyme (TIGR01210 family)